MGGESHNILGACEEGQKQGLWGKPVLFCAHKASDSVEFRFVMGDTRALRTEAINGRSIS